MTAPHVPQTLTVQYDVEAVDGVTPSRPFSRDNSNPAFIAPNAQQIYVVTQDAVGLIDPDLGVGGSLGDRFIPWIEVCVDEAATVELALVDGEDTSKVLDVLVAAGAATPEAPFYQDDLFRVPQGGLLRVRTTPESAGIKVRLRIQVECDDCPGPRGGGGPTGPTGPTGPSGPTGPTGPTGAGAARSLTRHFNMWNVPMGAESPPAPWQLDFADDFNLSGAPPGTGGRASSPCFNWIADAAGRLVKVTVMQVNSLGAPATLTVSFQVGAAPFAFDGAAPPISPFALAVVAAVGPIVVPHGTPTDFIIPVPLSTYAALDMLGVFISGWTGGPVSSAGVQAMATCQWESP